MNREPGPPAPHSPPEREVILLAHGAGGRKTHELVRDLFLPAFENRHLLPLSDAALLPPLPADATPVLTTDAFVVDPPRFPGGDVGYLSICGTINDLCVAGAQPHYLTWALILEEGADRELVAACTAGAARAAREAGVRVVAGDTKVVPRGKGDRIYVTTTGLGSRPHERTLGDEQIVAGDAILSSGPLGDHGATIMAVRHELDSEDLRSDCAPLVHLTEGLFKAGVPLHAMHDPTRGGAATTCNEAAERCGLRFVLDEQAIPVRPQVRAVCELLGLDPLALPCEGRALIWLPESAAARALEILRALPQGREAARIGAVTARPGQAAPVSLRSALGVARPLDMLSGSDLPRIC